MATIARLPLTGGTADPWAAVVQQCLGWSREHAVELRDAIVLVPFAQHLAPARRAWARAGGWMPRIESTQTLARSLGPPEAPADVQLRFDGPLDRLTARRLLRQQSGTAAWARRDPRGFDHAIGAVTQAAQALARASFALAPQARAAHWDRCRGALGTAHGPGATERLLGRIALEWAASAAAPPTDALFRLHPSAWIAVQAGGADALVEALLREASEPTPCVVIDADVSLDAPFAEAPAQIAVACCADFEDEALRAAAHVLEHLARAAKPVALIAQDRLLVRRVRALLARQGVPIQDETGWKLSTTRAGAGVANLLRAARRDAGADEWLDWLKGAAGEWPGVEGAMGAVEALEATLRRRAWTRPVAVDVSALGPASARLWQSAGTILGHLRVARSQPLAGWLGLLSAALEACGAMTFLESDDAGRQVLDALHLVRDARVADGLGGDEPLALEDFAAWVDGALEDGSFLPEAPANAPVVVTPLERAMLRPFAAVVLAGADEKRLGAMPAPLPLFDNAMAATLGLPTIAARRDRETLAFAQLLRHPHVTLLRRVDDGGEPLAPSPLLERLELARLREGRGLLPEAPDPLQASTVAAAPVPRPRPRSDATLPARLSASACEALRACPYRFHALYRLRLREADELDDEVEKRDYGTWLHAVLHRFHESRSAPESADVEVARLERFAREVQEEMHLDDAAFLPFGATFAGFAPRYVAWLHERDAAGARWAAGEQDLRASPPEWHGVAMEGRIDRVDRTGDGGGAALELIDYKTGSADVLKRKVKYRLEDTQLAFYAALVGAQPDFAGALAAAYLPLDERGEIKPIEHAEVETSARMLVEGIGAELERLRAGAELPALGEGTACTWCAARGLCRRDHWPAEEAAT